MPPTPTQCSPVTVESPADPFRVFDDVTRAVEGVARKGGLGAQ
jgi:hypothetical protein